MAQEIEVKIPIGEPGSPVAEACALIERHGFTVHRARVFERNLIFDSTQGELRESRRLLRLRQAGERVTLTFKGPAESGGRHKSREERETEVSDFGEMRTILEALGYRVAFVYEKYRTEYTRAPEAGTVTVDETPAGNFLELEGDPAWIDATSALLGFVEKDYLTASYSTVYRDWCRRKGIKPGNMTF